MGIREIHLDDTAAFLAHLRQLDQETTFMMLEPDERTTTEEQQRQRLEAMVRSGNQMILAGPQHGQEGSVWG